MIINKDKDLLALCRHTWERMAPFRDRRRLCMDYAYGRQWNRPVTLPDGRVMTEEQMLISKGMTPVTNNLTRQLVKTVVGKWRYLRSMRDDADPSLARALSHNCLREGIDARALEEFLISGLTAQLLPSAEGEPANISPARLLLSPFTREDASDCSLCGVLHDMPLSQALRLFSSGDAARHSALAELFAAETHATPPLFATRADVTFDGPASEGRLRVVEAWIRTHTALTRIHDSENASYIVARTDSRLTRALTTVNDNRAKTGRPLLSWHVDIEERWRHVCLAPDGSLLLDEIMPAHLPPPLVVRCYPMIDGEIHSLVEDVMSQQHYVNRLVMMLDEILRFSAKGVLLFPTEQLPKGMTWETLRRLWSTPGGIIPFQRTSRNIVPTQIVSSGTQSGAADMLRLQMEMFAKVSGTTMGVDSAGMNANSADMLRRQMEQEMVALLDVLAAFHAFVCARDARMVSEHEKGGET